MSGLGQGWQFAVTLASGWQGCLAVSAVLSLLVLSLWALGGAARGIACAWRTRRRNGRTAPGPPPGPFIMLVGWNPDVPRAPEGSRITGAEAQKLAVIAWCWEQGEKKPAAARIVWRLRHDEDARKRVSVRRLRPARKTKASVRTGRR